VSNRSIKRLTEVSSVCVFANHATTCYRFITMFATTPGTSTGGQLDLRTLRAVRVLRPLKLVSGVPSQSSSSPSHVLIVVIVLPVEDCRSANFNGL